MYQGLEDGVRDHNGSASIAFNGGKTGSGRQLMCKDRQVWGAMQEWLRNIFVDCCKIDGRDRRIMVRGPSSGSPHYPRAPHS